MDTQVEVQFATDVEAELKPEAITAWVKEALEAVSWQGARDVCVRVVDADEIQAMNESFRGKPNPTNVLSFPASAVDGLPADVDIALGDLIVCAEVVSAEAEAQGKPLLAHWTHMVVHGTLHLLGFDHESDEEAHEMESLEIRILAGLGIDNPYAESLQKT